MARLLSDCEHAKPARKLRIAHAGLVCVRACCSASTSPGEGFIHKGPRVFAGPVKGELRLRVVASRYGVGS